MRSSFIATAVSLSLVGITAAENVAAAIRKDTNIPAQQLELALQELARSRDFQVIYRSEIVGEIRSSGAVGNLTPAEALTQLLSQTGLTYRYLDDHTVTILPLASAAGAASSAKMDVVELEEIVVTGTHIRGADNLTVPLIVMNREFIDATGLTTTVQLVESLPQNFALVNESVPAAGRLSGNSLSNVQGSSVNLRGIGEGTTLTLVNGRRMALGYDGSAVNIAAIPLAAIERVEVLTDGASALYGSDAVGGVVNFVLRKDFDGAESRARYGHADSVDDLRLSQVVGHDWRSGNFVVSAEHYERDMLLARDRDFGTGGRSTVGSLLPQESNYGLTFFGRQDIAEHVELFADVLYTDRDSENRGGHLTLTQDWTYYVDNAQLSATAGLNWDLGAGWRVEVSGGYGEDDLDLDYTNPPALASSGQTAILSKFTGTDVKADGPLLALPGGMLRVAVGGHWREEDHSYDQVNRNAAGAATTTSAFSRERQVGSVFAEVLVPIVGSANAVTGIDRLELSLAGRYDDYSDFGSSFDPRVGLAWMPTQGLTLRGSWSSSYLAPKMKDFDVSLNAASAIDNSTAANGMHLLALTGNAAEALQAQQSDNFTIGLEWMPQSLRGASFSVTYYHIDYRDKIESVTVPIGTMLANPAAYPGVLILDPTLDQVNQYIALGAVSGRLFQALIQTPSGGLVPNPNFDPGSVELIVDSRRRNVGVVASRGFDVSAAYDIAMLGGEMRIGFDGAWIEDLLRQVTRTSSAISTLDTYGNPTHLRLRAQLGYRRGGWSFNSFVHHRNSYTDNRFTPFVELDSYTTVDANVAYRFASATGVLSGLSITFGAINLLDRDPPAARIRPTVAQYDLGFDPANASPLGRLLAIDVAKRW